MTTTIWRYAHLALAICSFLFLSIASLTGVILAIDAIQERALPYRIEHVEDITLAQALPVLKEKYSEIYSIGVDHNQFVTIEGLDNEGNDIKAIIHPLNGEKLADAIVKSDFYQWNLALHRSLFLKETGRFVVGFVSFLLLLITISGTVLIIKRQQGVKKFFSKVHKDFFAQYYHVFTTRLLLIPILAISLTGTYLFLLRFDWLESPRSVTKELLSVEDIGEEKYKELKDFELFQQLKLVDVEKVDFPFIEDPEEFYIIKSNEREWSVHQFSGDIISETTFDKTKFWEKFNVDIHTGRTSIIWAIILAIASINIIFFIVTGFIMTFKRWKIKIPKNKYTSHQAEIVLLIGSANGTTIGFARNIHRQLLAAGKKSFIAELNQYQKYPQLQHLIIFTSTYGIGEAPYNARHFLDLLKKYPQRPGVEYSVVGFGSTSYEQFCEYAYEVDRHLSELDWAVENLPVFSINDKSPDEFVQWVKVWQEKNLIPLATAPSLYKQKIPHLIDLEVVESAQLPEGEDVFQVFLKPIKKNKFQSGDLLAIYPANDHRERFYSISRQKGLIQLVVKLHQKGLGSQYLHKLKKGEKISARIIQNELFHFPSKKKEVALIANGTGIAPFLGMISNNSSKKAPSLYCGFRYNNRTSQNYAQFAQKQINKGRLKLVKMAFSKEEHPAYVMDLIRQDADEFTRLLSKGGIVMICGSLAMLRDVEKVLDEICIKKLGVTLSKFKDKGQIKSDCY